jgi:ATPases involved in chromosome partitioning
MNIQDVETVLMTASGKGGVGKTTIATDIAKALSADGLSVGLVDADISTPNAPEVVGEGDVDLTDQRLSTGDALVPADIDGLQVVSKGMVLPDDVPILRDGQWRAEAALDYIQNVEWADDTDVVVIDSPPGSGEELQSVVAAVPIDHGFVITTPHPSSVRDSTKTVEFFKDADIDHSAIVNMSHIEGTALVEHVLSTADLTKIQGVGEATAESIEELLTEEAIPYPLFRPAEGSRDLLDARTDVTLPYTSESETRQELLSDVARKYLADMEVEQ